MKKTICTALAVLSLALLAGCGGGDAEEPVDTAGTTAGSTAGNTPVADADLEATLSDANEKVRVDHKMEYDPGAVYGMDAVPVRGNFLKLNFTRLNEEQLNRTLHRLKTEHSRCTGCDGLFIEEILAGKPQCNITLEVAKNIIKEEERRPKGLQ